MRIATFVAGLFLMPICSFVTSLLFIYSFLPRKRLNVPIRIACLICGSILLMISSFKPADPIMINFFLIPGASLVLHGLGLTLRLDRRSGARITVFSISLASLLLGVGLILSYLYLLVKDPQRLFELKFLIYMITASFLGFLIATKGFKALRRVDRAVEITLSWEDKVKGRILEMRRRKVAKIFIEAFGGLLIGLGFYIFKEHEIGILVSVLGFFIASITKREFYAIMSLDD